MEFSILYAIQNLHCEVLDRLILLLNTAAGQHGELWLVVGALCCIFKKTRKCGIAVLLSYALVYLSGQIILKDLIARARPCQIDETVALLVERPTSYSCPSTHTAWAFAAAASVWMFHKKAGVGVLVIALLIGFSRLYLFVHFPTDVLLGAVLGVLAGAAAAQPIRWWEKRRKTAA